MDSSSLAFLLLFLLFIKGTESDTTMFTFKNNCNYTIWVALASKHPSPTPPITGLEIASNAQDSLQSPDPNWQGVIWPRTGCTKTSTPPGAAFQCDTGDCRTGTMMCEGSWFTPPVTLIEFSMGGGHVPDEYDVNLLAGFNVPVSVVPQGGGSCITATCPTDINTVCPVEGQIKDDNGRTIACKSACGAHSGDPQYCCNGCGSNPYTNIFVQACPVSICYPVGTAKFGCSAPNYVITFCPAP